MEFAMSNTRKLWLGLGVLLIASFAVLLWSGGQIFRAAPPIPDRVVSQDGQVVYTRADIEQGRQVWQSIGGMELGSIWGHGSYVAPDWSADWLHREATDVLDQWARRDFNMPVYAHLSAEQQGALRGRLQQVMRTNTYDPATKTITLAPERVIALSNVAAHYESLFGNDPATQKLREGYAMRQGTVDTMEHRRALTAFIWWTAWGATTERPGDTRFAGPRRPRQPEGHLHQQLAERTAGGQHAAARAVAVVGFQRSVPDRRHCGAGLASRGQPRSR